MNLPSKVYLNKGATTGWRGKPGKMQTILEAKLAISKWSFISRKDGKRKKQSSAHDSAFEWEFARKTTKNK